MPAAQSGSVTPLLVTRSAAAVAAVLSAGDPIAARIRSSASASGVSLTSAAGTREAASSAMTSALSAPSAPSDSREDSAPMMSEPHSSASIGLCRWASTSRASRSTTLDACAGRNGAKSAAMSGSTWAMRGIVTRRRPFSGRY
jgi:hypothetical protein